MRIERLTIHRMPGIHHPFTVEMRPGLNLIVGPNGVGKSTLCRAVRALLWPTAESPQTLSVESRWTIDEVPLAAEREGRGATVWLRDGARDDGPDLPRAGLARCYTIGLTDLFTEQSTPTDEAITDEVLRQMTGGFDLDAVASTHFRLTAGQQESRALEKRRAALEKLKGERARLARIEDSLAELRAEHEQAKKAGGRLALLLLERDARNAVAAFDEAERALGRWADTAVPRLDGQEQERLDGLNERIDRATRELDACRLEIAGAERAVKAANLPDAGVDEHRVAEALAHAARIATLEPELDRRGVEVRSAARRLAEAARGIDREWDPDTAPVFDRESMQAAAGHLHAAATRRHEAAVTDRLLDQDVLAVDSEVIDAQALDRAITALEAWLTAAPTTARHALAVQAGIGFLLVAGGGAAAALAWHWSGALFAGAGLVAALVTILLARGAASAAVAARELFAGGGFAPPTRWEIEAVRRRLVELRGALARHAGDHARRAIRDQFAARQRQLEKERVRLAAEREELRQRIGAAPDADALDIAEFARLVHAYRDARQALADAEAARDQTRDDIDRRLAGLNGVLEAFGYEPATDAAAAQARVSDLEKRNRALTEARNTLTREQPHAADLTAELENLGAKRDLLFTALDLEPGDSGGLARLLDELPRYRKARAQHEKKEDRRDTALTRRAEHPLHDRHPEFAALDREALDARIDEETRLEQQSNELAHRIGGIESDVRRAREGSDHEEARAAQEDAQAALDQVRDDVLFARAGRLLLERTRGAYEQHSRPAVETEASRLFQTFTHDAYELRVRRVDERKAEFLAMDIARGDLLPLNALSDGTRAQLFLAARLAFAFATEREVKPPIFLDEALSNSDPDRFDAVVRSLAAIASVEHGERQVFYLTSNPGDVALWNRTLAETGRAPLEPIDLAAIRGLAAAAAPEQLDPPPLSAPPPPPDGMGAAAYGRLLGVAEIDPAGNPAAVPLFYLLSGELPTLHALLAARIATVGAWRRLRPTAIQGKFLCEEDALRLDVRIAALEAFLTARRIGRPRPVTRDLLEATDAITDNFIERVAEIAREHEGDGARLLAALEDGAAKGFRKKNLDPLRDHLEEHGSVDNRPRLDETEVHARVLDATAAHLAQGRLTAAEITNLVHTLWAAV